MTPQQPRFGVWAPVYGTWGAGPRASPAIATCVVGTLGVSPMAWDRDGRLEQLRLVAELAGA